MDIRQATVQDKPQILELLKTLDLYYHDQPLNDFWVAEENGKIIGVVRLEEFPDFSFISSLGVLEVERKKGIASQLLKHLFELTKKDLYLYTIIPDFFKKFGFQIPNSGLPTLPLKDTLECSACSPGKCVTMVKFHNGA
ncbi:MAG: GNAT family N-acetyltransferase [bacterium]